MHLVVGATGLVGHAVCLGLAQAGERVRALTRRRDDDEKVKALRDAGVELVRGDLKDPASVAAACRGIQVVVSTASSTLSSQPGDSIQTVDRDGQIGLVQAARATKVEHFVFLSFTGNMDAEFPLRNAKRAVETLLRESGMSYTILRPSVFMEVWLSPALGFDVAGGRARIYGEGLNPISWISLRDVAAYTVASALRHPAALKATIELGGPEPLAPLDVVGIFERVTGRTFDVEHVPVEALRQQRVSATDPLQQSFAALMLGYAGGDVIDMRDTIRKFAITPMSVEQYARAVTAAA